VVTEVDHEPNRRGHVLRSQQPVRVFPADRRAEGRAGRDQTGAITLTLTRCRRTSAYVAWASAASACLLDTYAALFG
jgi:hypothetical protein